MHCEVMASESNLEIPNGLQCEVAMSSHLNCQKMKKHNWSASVLLP